MVNSFFILVIYHLRKIDGCAIIIIIKKDVMYAKVIIDQDAKALDRVFEYIVPDDLDIVTGMRVYVPFGSRILQGFVVDLCDRCEYDPSKLKKNHIKNRGLSCNKARDAFSYAVYGKEKPFKASFNSKTFYSGGDERGQG